MTASHYLGTDIIEIARIADAIERYGDRFLHRIYFADELKAHNGAASLAAVFAGKEAVLKVIGTGMIGARLGEVEILTRPGGKPYVVLHGRAEKAAERLGIREIEISLSHSREYATATALGIA